MLNEGRVSSNINIIIICIRVNGLISNICQCYITNEKLCYMMLLAMLKFHLNHINYGLHFFSLSSQTYLL